MMRTTTASTLITRRGLLDGLVSVGSGVVGEDGRADRAAVVVSQSAEAVGDTVSVAVMMCPSICAVAISCAMTLSWLAWRNWLSFDDSFCVRRGHNSLMGAQFPTEAIFIVSLSRLALSLEEVGKDSMTQFITSEALLWIC